MYILHVKLSEPKQKNYNKMTRNNIVKTMPFPQADEIPQCKKGLFLNNYFLREFC